MVFLIRKLLIRPVRSLINEKKVMSENLKKSEARRKVLEEKERKLVALKAVDPAWPLAAAVR